MSRRFSRAYGEFDIEACEEYYDSIDSKDARQRHHQLEEKGIIQRRRNPQEKNRDRQQAREIKEARLTYFR